MRGICVLEPCALCIGAIRVVCVGDEAMRESVVGYDEWSNEE